MFAVRIGWSLDVRAGIQLYVLPWKLITYVVYFFVISATAPMLPPCLPNPPPPPPIEDIPQRTHMCMPHQRSFGPSHRGNYSDAETCLCSRHYAESHVAAMQHRGHYSDPDNPTRVRPCAYSEGESDFEPHYLEQTASGNVFIPGKLPWTLFCNVEWICHMVKQDFFSLFVVKSIVPVYKILCEFVLTCWGRWSHTKCIFDPP